jgi:hypothetical protein
MQAVDAGWPCRLAVQAGESRWEEVMKDSFVERFQRLLIEVLRRCVGARSGAWLASVMTVVVAPIATAVNGDVARSERGGLSAKQIAAPPEDLLDGTLRLGDPPAELSHYALLPVAAEFDRVALGERDDAARWRVRRVIPHAGGSLAIAAIMQALPAPWSPWELRVLAPDGSVILTGPIQAAAGGAAGQQGVSDVSRGASDRWLRGPVGVRRGTLASLMPSAAGAESVRALRIDLVDAAQGEWTVEIVSTRTPVGGADAIVAGEVAPRGVVVTAPEDGLALRWMASDWLARVGVPKTYLLEALSERGDGCAIESIDATLEGPDGTVERLVPVGATVSFLPTRAGTHVVHAIATLRSRDGARSQRSATVVADVSESAITLRGAGGLEPLDALRHRVRLEVDGARRGDGSSESVLLCGEVWLREVDAEGVARERPICWIASMVEPVFDDRGGAHLGLAFDRRWLGRAGGIRQESVAGELSLREVRMHDRSSGSLIDRASHINIGAAPAAVPFDPREEASLLRGRPGGLPIRATVRAVSLPSDDSPPDSDAALGSHALMLVHGYCSDGSPFPANHFTGAVAQFLDPNVARSHDEFAQLIAAFGANFKSYGTVAHSQGGMASLHLYTFYWSGLDWAEGPRLIQSVGAPYQGTPLAGNLAVLGGIFGVGCGSVADMTPEGSTAWLSTIPTWARQRVWYWTTSYKDFPFSYDYCDFISDLFLSNPDDGVIERVRGQLPGGNNMGHTEGWCHVADMEDPPQCTDQTRNTQMNANAAR